MTKRDCGNCTACCKTHGVFETFKMPGVWCEHCSIGKGCQIYEMRPDECRDFQCAWLMGIGDLHHRPDITNIVPEYRDIVGIGMGMWFWELEKGALNSTFTRNWTRRNLSVGNCVMHVGVEGNPKLYLSNKVSDNGFRFVMDGTGREVEVVPFPKSIQTFMS